MNTIQRPKLLSIICITGYLWMLVSFPAIFSPSVKKLGDFYPALFGIITACTFISFVGVWHMKKWGVQLFAITFFVKESLLVSIDDIGTTAIAGIVVSVIFILVFLFQYKKMDGNL